MEGLVKCLNLSSLETAAALSQLAQLWHLTFLWMSLVALNSTLPAQLFCRPVEVCHRHILFSWHNILAKRGSVAACVMQSCAADLWLSSEISSGLFCITHSITVSWGNKCSNLGSGRRQAHPQASRVIKMAKIYVTFLKTLKKKKKKEKTTDNKQP